MGTYNKLLCTRKSSTGLVGVAKANVYIYIRWLTMKSHPLRRNIKKSEQVQSRPAATLPKSKTRNFVVSFARTNKGGGRKP